MISSWESKTPVKVTRFKNFLKLHCLPDPVGVDYHKTLSSRCGDFQTWVNLVRRKDVAWVDVHGDTPLIAIIKEWPDEADERLLGSIIHDLINSGAELHMRDRRGYTALAAAVQRGLRPAVKALVNLGANLNSRSYHGTSILALAMAHLQRARKEGDIRRYGMIVSCMTYLSDKGAKTKPTVYEEFDSKAFRCQSLHGSKLWEMG